MKAAAQEEEEEEQGMILQTPDAAAILLCLAPRVNGRTDPRLAMRHELLFGGMHY